MADDAECVDRSGNEGASGGEGQSVGVGCCEADVRSFGFLFFEKKKVLILIVYLNSLKSANPAKQEHARLEVENAEDDLVQKTEVAITLMRTVLENVSLSFIIYIYKHI